MTPTGEDRGDGDGNAVGVVLAGGESTRFAGGDKALATVAGEPILVGVAATLREATERPPIVAVRTDEQRERYGRVLPGDVAFADDATGFSGPLAGVVGAAEAAEAAGATWLFVCGCDMPLLSAAAVRWLVERADATDADVLAVSDADGAAQPLHACYRRTAVLTARDRLSEGGGVRTLIGVLDSTGFVSVDDAPPGVPLAESLSNVNTRDDLDGIRERLADAG